MTALPRQHSTILFRSVGLLVLLLTGCGDSSGVGKTVSVAGAVTLDGSPLAQGSLVFKPDAAKGNTSPLEPAAPITDGRYQLFTSGKPGAPPGWYKIVVIATEKIKPDDVYSPLRSLINKKYTDVASTDLAVEVLDTAAAGAYDLKLAR